MMLTDFEMEDKEIEWMYYLTGREDKEKERAMPVEGVMMLGNGLGILE